MTFRLAFALATAAMLSAPPAVAQQAATGEESAHYQAAYRFAQELRDEKSVAIEVSRAFEADSIALIAQNPDLAQIEKEFPGAIKYMFDAARPESERQVIASLPSLWSALATLFSAELTPAEIESARLYYSSPAGKRFKTAILRNYDVKQEIAPLSKDLEAKIDPSMIRRGIEGGAKDAFADLSAEDQAALLRFAGTPAFQKIRTLNSRILQISADWGNASNPEFEARLEQVMSAAMEEFVVKNAP